MECSSIVSIQLLDVQLYPTYLLDEHGILMLIVFVDSSNPQSYCDVD